MYQLILSIGQDEKGYWFSYQCPQSKQVVMNQFYLHNLAPELVPENLPLYDENDLFIEPLRYAASCAFYYGLETFYEIFGDVSLNVKADFDLDLVLLEWKEKVNLSKLHIDK